MFRVVTDIDDLVKAYIVRAVVFMGEQDVAYDEEIDGHDHEATHVIGELDGEPVAAGRIRFLGDTAKVERLAIRRKWRGRGYGDRLLRFLVGEARRRGAIGIKLHAQVQALGFYQKHGFRPVGECFDEAGIEHRLMVLGK